VTVRPDEQPGRWAAMQASAELISSWTTHLIRQSYVEGVKDGLEGAARWCDDVAQTIRGKPEGVFECDVSRIAVAETLRAVAETLRDRLRLEALQVADPDPPAPPA